MTYIPLTGSSTQFRCIQCHMATPKSTGMCDACARPPSTVAPLVGVDGGGGTKYDAGKPQMSLIPPEALIEVAKVLTYGRKKYPAEHNWRKGMEWSRPLDACYRHLAAWQQRVTIDEESGLRHLAHAIVNLMFLLVYELLQLGKDDRP